MEDFKNVLAQVQKAQRKVQEIQHKLNHIQATGESGAGAVKATVDGHKKVLKLEIDKEFLHPGERETLQDLIIAAITLATQAVSEKVREEVKQDTSDMLGGLPIDLMH